MLTHRVAKVVFFLVAKAVFISSKPHCVKNTSFNGFLVLTHRAAKVRFFLVAKAVFLCRFHSGGLGVEGVFAGRGPTVCNRAHPFATGRVRAVWPCLW